MIRFCKDFISAQKKSGSVILMVLGIISFCTTILTLFISNVLQDTKYRQEMQSSTHLKVEAYSFLDLALAFLGSYQLQHGNHFFFDSEILHTDPNDTSISQYITKAIGDINHATSNLKFQFKAHAHSSAIMHDNFIIKYSFKDLSAKVPFNNKFDNSSQNLGQQLIKQVITNSLNQNKLLSLIQGQRNVGWSAIESQLNKISPISMVQNSMDSLKEYFTIESGIIRFIEGKNNQKQFKVNLTAADDKIRSAIFNTARASLSSRKRSDCDQFLQEHNELKKYCSPDVQFFSLTVSVSNEENNTYKLLCLCEVTDSNDGRRRLPFNIIKIEEI